MAFGPVHRWLTQDSLTGFVAGKRLNRIAGHAVNADRFLTHGERSCHRVGGFQEEFEKYGYGWKGESCRFPGAEEQAALLLGRSVTMKGEWLEWEKDLGYTIHHIQDALCPEHVFPFQENMFDKRFFAPHGMYALHVLIHYRWNRNWQQLVRNAPIIQISSPGDLRDKIAGAADWVRSFPCSYRRQDGQLIIDSRAGKTNWAGWKMSDEYTGRWLERVSSLTKGTILFVQQARPLDT